MEHKMIKAYLLRAEKNTVYKGIITEIENDLQSINNYVKGDLQILSLNEHIVIICEKDAVIMGRTLNRAMYNAKGERINVFAGNLLLLKKEGENFINIEQEDIVDIEKMLKPIEHIFGGEVIIKEQKELKNYI